MSTPGTEESIVDLQIRLAYQEDTLNELSDVVVRQQQHIEQLTARLDHLTSRLSALPVGEPPEPEPPPPHY